MDTDDELHALLQQLGVRVAYAELPDDRDGEYCAADRLIRLRPNMPRRLHRSVLAHECAHALRGRLQFAVQRRSTLRGGCLRWGVFHRLGARLHCLVAHRCRASVHCEKQRTGEQRQTRSSDGEFHDQHLSVSSL